MIDTTRDLAAFIEALPTSQGGTLRAIYDKGGRFSENSPSVLWTSPSATLRIVQALAKKGLLSIEEGEIVLYRGGPNERTVPNAVYTVHPLVSEVFRAKDKVRNEAAAARSAATRAAHDAAALGRDVKQMATGYLIQAHREEYAKMLASIEAKLREERGL